MKEFEYTVQDQLGIQTGWSDCKACQGTPRLRDQFC